MKTLTMIAITLTTLMSPIAFAHESSSACKAVVHACKAAGFERHHEHKKFWKGCMEPVLLGKHVKHVHVQATQVKACREKKIDTLQKELKKLQSVR